MSHTVPSEPAVVLRSDYRRLRALLLVAIVAIVALTIAVVLLATTNGTGAVATSATGTNATGASTAAIHANAIASQEAGAKLDHSGRNGFAGQASSSATGAPQVGPNRDQRDLVGSGGAFPAAAPNPDQATPSAGPGLNHHPNPWWRRISGNT